MIPDTLDSSALAAWLPGATLPSLLLIAFLGAAISFLLLPRVGKAAGAVAAILPASLFAAFVTFVPVLAVGDGVPNVLQTVQWVPSLGIDFDLRLDGFSLLFVLMITGIGTLVALYAGSYYAEKPAADRGRFLSYILLFMAAMLGTVLSDNLVVMFVFWEMTSLISFLLIGFNSTSADARKAALQSLVITAGGGLALFGGILLIGMEAGTFSLMAITQDPGLVTASPWFGVIATLVLLGAFTKSAQFPFHFWLPNAMQAPTPASAYLHSATMVKLGVFLLARFDPVLTASQTVAMVIVGVGLVTMLVSAVLALRSEGLKAILAYSTVASLALLVTLIGLDGPTTTVGIAGFILAHALYKAALFFCAGIVIHATGATRIRDLGALFGLLPLTAISAILASLSMAGLPPFVGFIAKEYVFEAKLDSSFAAIVTLVAVIVNSVLVAIAAIVALRPFFARTSAFKGTPKHGETLGMTTGPVVLATLGVFFGLFADIPQYYIVGPAAIALAGTPFYVSFEIWHGLTPMLALSALVVALGGLLVWKWVPIHTALGRLSFLDRYSVEKGYDALFNGLLGLARVSTQTIQNGDMRTYLVATIAVVTGALGYAILAGGFGADAAGLSLPAFAGEEIRPYLVIVSLLVAVGAVVAALARSMVVSLVGVGLSGYGIAILFLKNGAPDLALTQFLVETLFVVIVTAVLVRLPAIADGLRSYSRFDLRPGDAVLSGVFGLALFVVLLSIAAKPFNPTVTDYYAATSLTEAFGRNVVNVILVDFRALDTLGEIAVVAFAAIAAWAVLAGGGGRKTATGTSDRALPSLIFATTARMFFVLMLVVSLIALFRGHNEPGGGFIGGLIASAGFAVLALALGIERARRALLLHPVVWMGVGLVLAILSGIPGAVLDESFLTHKWAELNLGFTTLKVGTTYLFDIGVYLTVIGGVLAFLIRIQEQSAGGSAGDAPAPVTAPQTPASPYSPSTRSSAIQGASA
ncbi:hydrogen gas-evolving membrane-bound hydrogenase subunit E [Stappia sp.]|uniref:hydrogen gas-evolving membrane-bound hydrogenase subunit E n=1 Tax=Stappia sp. TaxID=1870903 RepID=UPI0032D95A2C